MATIIYIAGCTHSGSTLLHRVLGAHSRAVTIGGSKHLPAFSRTQKKCSCGAESPEACHFWSRVDESLAESGSRLIDMGLDSPDIDCFRRDNIRLYEAIQRVSGAEVIIDTSRHATRLRRLQAVPEINLLPVHLFKEPARQASSWKTKNTPLKRCVKKYWGVNVEIDKLCRRSPQYYHLSYEAFCSDPGRFTLEILAKAGLDYEPNILLNWGEQTLHVLGGNRMKANTSSVIKLDESYKRHLSVMDTVLVRGACSILHRRLRALTV